LRRVTFSAAVMLVLAGLSPSQAETPSDFRIQSDRATFSGVDPDNAYAIDDQVYSANYRYIESLLADGYPLHSVILHAVSRGMTVSDTAYYLTLAEPDSAEEIWATFAELLPSLPSWVCSSELDMSYYTRSSYDLAELTGKPTIRAVAERFFANGERLRYRRPQNRASRDWEEPDWTRGEYHFKASIDELIALAQADTFNGEQGWWYQSAAPADDIAPVFVGLYRRNNEIVVDTPLQKLQAVKQTGTGEVPVIIVFNSAEYLPTYRLKSDLPRKPGESGATRSQRSNRGKDQPTISDVANAYFGQPFIGARVTPTREWHRRDYHIMAAVAEIDELFDLPEVRDLPAGERERHRAGLAQGFDQPVLVTLFGDAKKMWVDDPGRVAVAAGLGMREVPVAFFYHELRRYACNLPGACLPAAREAILAGVNAPKPTPSTGVTTTPVTPVLPALVVPPGGIVLPPDGRPPEPTSPE
jgi:hypothetical protein